MLDALAPLFLGWSIQFLGGVSPGPGVALVMGVAAAQGRRAAMITTFGIACASIVLASVTALGLTALLAQWSAALEVLRWFGVAYLGWLALKAFRSALTAKVVAPAAPIARPAWRMALTGFGLQLTNPKSLFFWIAIATVGGLASVATWQLVVFVAGAFCISFTTHGTYGLLLSTASVRRGYERARALVDGALGVVFAAFCYKLATERF